MIETFRLADVEKLVDTAAVVLDLPLNPAHRPGVIANMQILLAHMQVVNGFLLPFDATSASEFIA